MALQLKLEREKQQKPLGPTSNTQAKLLVGSLHDDALLLYENISIEAFPSPYVVSLSTQSCTKGESENICAGALTCI